MRRNIGWRMRNGEESAAAHRRKICGVAKAASKRRLALAAAAARADHQRRGAAKAALKSLRNAGAAQGSQCAAAAESNEICWSAACGWRYESVINSGEEELGWPGGVKCERSYLAAYENWREASM